jgi:hypothetical protein
MEPDQYTCRTLIASLEQTRRGGFQLGTAFWLPPNHAREHKNVMAWQSRAPPTVYLLPTCRIYVDKSGHISGAERQLDFRHLAIAVGAVKDLIGSTSSKRGVMFMGSGICNFGEKEIWWTKREYLFNIIFEKMGALVYSLFIW